MCNTVTDTIAHVDPLVVVLTLDTDDLETTLDHPFFTRTPGWVAARQLTPGAQVRRLDGSYGAVTRVVLAVRVQPMYNLTVATAHTFFVGDDGWLVHNCAGAKGLIGHAFEDYLVKTLGGKGSFKAGGREFDGAVGNRWYEAKSGGYWDRLLPGSKAFQKFQSDMGDYQRIAKKNGATYELHSNTPIPQHVKDWLQKKGIPFFEHME